MPTLPVMRFCAPAADLRDALATAAHATPARPTLVAYSGCLLVVRKGRLSVIGSDGETTIAARVHATGTTDGQVLLPPRPLQNFLQTLPADLEVVVEAGDADVAVQAGGLAPYRFRPVSGSFPMPPVQKAEPTKVDFERLPTAIAAVRAAASKEDTGVELVSDDTGLSLRTTDRYRLHAAWLPEAGFDEFSGVVPLAVLDRLARHDVSGVTADGKGRTIRFAGPEVVISARLLAVPFPPVETYLAMRQPIEFGVPVAAMSAALARLAAVAEAAPVFVTASGDELRLEVSNTDLGSGVEVIELPEPVAAKVSFAADRVYLADAMAAHDTEVVEMSYAAALLPVLFRSEEPFPVLTLIQPIRTSYNPETTAD